MSRSSAGLPTQSPCQRGLEPHRFGEHPDRSDLRRCKFCGLTVVAAASPTEPPTPPKESDHG